MRPWHGCLWRSHTRHTFLPRAALPWLSPTLAARRLQSLEAWWKIAVTYAQLARPGTDELEFEDYRDIHRLLYEELVGEEEYDEEEADEAAKDEWEAELQKKRSAFGTGGIAGSSNGMAKERFVDGMFELVDLYVPSLSADDYAEFLDDLLEEISMNLKVNPRTGRGGRGGPGGPGGPGGGGAGGGAYGSYDPNDPRTRFDPNDPRIPPGGSIGPNGEILDANGNPVLGADGKPLYARANPNYNGPGGAGGGFGNDPRIPPGGRVGPGGIILDEFGNPVLGADGKPMYVTDPRIPPGGSIGPNGEILDANGNPVLGADGKPLYAGIGMPGMGGNGALSQMQRERERLRLIEQGIEAAAASKVQANLRGKKARKDMDGMLGALNRKGGTGVEGFNLSQGREKVEKVWDEEEYWEEDDEDEDEAKRRKQPSELQTSYKGAFYSISCSTNKLRKWDWATGACLGDVSEVEAMAAVLCPRALASITTATEASVIAHRQRQTGEPNHRPFSQPEVPPDPLLAAAALRPSPPPPAPPAAAASGAKPDVGAGQPLLSIDLDEGPDAKPVSEQLAAALRANATRVLDLFKSWDVDGNGEVSRREFHEAMPALGLEVPAADIDILFNEWDKDGGGAIGYRELKKILRTDGKGGGKKIELSGNGSLSEQLAEALRANSSRLMKLFKSWDRDGDGQVSLNEFRKAIPALGLVVPPWVIDGLFESWDKDGGGSLAYRELKRILNEKPAALQEANAPAALRAANGLAHPPLAPIGTPGSSTDPSPPRRKSGRMMASLRAASPQPHGMGVIATTAQALLAPPPPATPREAPSAGFGAFMPPSSMPTTRGGGGKRATFSPDALGLREAPMSAHAALEKAPAAAPPWEALGMFDGPPIRTPLMHEIPKSAQPPTLPPSRSIPFRNRQAQQPASSSASSTSAVAAMHAALFPGATDISDHTPPTAYSGGAPLYQSSPAYSALLSPRAPSMGARLVDSLMPSPRPKPPPHVAAHMAPSPPLFPHPIKNYQQPESAGTHAHGAALGQVMDGSPRLLAPRDDLAAAIWRERDEHIRRFMACQQQDMGIGADGSSSPAYGGAAEGGSAAATAAFNSLLSTAERAAIRADPLGARAGSAAWAPSTAAYAGDPTAMPSSSPELGSYLASPLGLSPPSPRTRYPSPRCLPSMQYAAGMGAAAGCYSSSPSVGGSGYNSSAGPSPPPRLANCSASCMSMGGNSCSAFAPGAHRLAGGKPATPRPQRPNTRKIRPLSPTRDASSPRSRAGTAATPSRFVCTSDPALSSSPSSQLKGDGSGGGKGGKGGSLYAGDTQLYSPFKGASKHPVWDAVPAQRPF